MSPTSKPTPPQQPWTRRTCKVCNWICKGCLFLAYTGLVVGLTVVGMHLAA